MVYICQGCHKKLTKEEVVGRATCPHCGYKILLKERPPVIRRVKAV